MREAILAVILSAAVQHGVSGPLMQRIAFCESSLDVNATNGQFLGLFQMGARKRAWMEVRALSWGVVYDWRDAAQQAVAAAEVISGDEGTAPWESSAGCWR